MHASDGICLLLGETLYPIAPLRLLRAVLMRTPSYGSTPQGGNGQSYQRRSSGGRVVSKTPPNGSEEAGERVFMLRMDPEGKLDCLTTASNVLLSAFTYSSLLVGTVAKLLKS